MAPQWYVLCSQPRKEEVVCRQLLTHDFKVFYPCLKVHPANPRSRTIKPYFPGYLFVHVALDEVGLSIFRWMPHANGLVCFGGIPASVPDLLVEAIRRHVSEIAAAGGELFYSLKPGDLITIQRGPFSGYEGIFDTRLNGSDRVRVLLKMLNDRYVPIELCVGQIEQK
jgi:transcription antitermination factor NusG